MKALLCTQFGPPDLLEIRDLPSPAAGPGEVVITVKAASVNFPDVLIIQNKYQFKPRCRSRRAASSRASSRRWALASRGFASGRSRDGVHDLRRLRRRSEGRVASRPAGARSEWTSTPRAALLLTYGTMDHGLRDRGALQSRRDRAGARRVGRHRHRVDRDRQGARRSRHRLRVGRRQAGGVPAAWRRRGDRLHLGEPARADQGVDQGARRRRRLSIPSAGRTRSPRCGRSRGGGGCSWSALRLARFRRSRSISRC